MEREENVGSRRQREGKEEGRDESGGYHEMNGLGEVRRTSCNILLLHRDWKTGGEELNMGQRGFEGDIMEWGGGMSQEKKRIGR